MVQEEKKIFNKQMCVPHNLNGRRHIVLVHNSASISFYNHWSGIIYPIDANYRVIRYLNARRCLGIVEITRGVARHSGEPSESC